MVLLNKKIYPKKFYDIDTKEPALQTFYNHNYYRIVIS